MGGFGRTMCAVVLAAVIPNAAAQQPNCTQRSTFVRYLSETYAEMPVAVGIADNGNVTELLRSKTGNSWTIIMTTPEGIACRIAAGEHWQPLPGVVTQEH